MIESQIEIATQDGATTTFVCHPERGGPYPVIVFYMDAPAIREELRDMVRRLATVGYYVMLPNLYYRSGVMELDETSRPRMFELMDSLTIPRVMDDTRALLGFAADDEAASDGPIGVVGYCMSGPFAINAAAVFPDRVAAAASIYGVRLATEADDSPHKVAGRARGELYFACAEIDRWAPMAMVEELKAALPRTGVKAEVEIYPGVEHGFAFPQRAAYDRDAAERHWERLFSLFRRRLGPATTAGR
ncbi:MAG TPA: dienelactone hydrolase family protein [Caulobacteraceae bacterium]